MSGAPPGPYGAPGIRPPGGMPMAGGPAGGPLQPGVFPGAVPAGGFARPPGMPGMPGPGAAPPGGPPPGVPGMPPGALGGVRPPFPGAMPFPAAAPGAAPIRPPGPGGFAAPPPGAPMGGPGPMGAAPGAIPPQGAPVMHAPPGPGIGGPGPAGVMPHPQAAPAAAAGPGGAPLFRPPGMPGMLGPGGPAPGAFPAPAPGGGVPMHPPGGVPGPGGVGMPAGPGGMGMRPPMPGPMGGGVPGMPPPGVPPGPPGMMGGPPGPHGPPGGHPGVMHPPPGAPGMMPGMMPPPPGAPGMMPPPPGGMGMGGPPGMPGYDPYGAQRMAEQFESLALGAGAGPGQPEAIDPSQLPRPLSEAATVAPPAQQPYDQGNCHPDNMRLTVNCVPNSAALRARWAMPLGLVVRPMADEAKGRSVPVVNLGSAGIVRCRRCRTYMNPYVQWTDGGRRFRCNVCAMLNEIPVEYFCNLDQDGRRKDLPERPELAFGTVEYVAPAEYMVRPPMPPVYFFLIDVTYAAVSSGMVAAACRGIKASLDGLPGDERTMVGFMTYDSTLQFYNLKSTLSQPQILVVTELDEPFVPLHDELLVNLRESRTIIDALLDSLPNTVASNTTVESGMGPALQAAFMVMAHLGGKLLLFQCSPPSLGIGKIKNRDNPQLYGTDREATIRQSDDPFYKRFAAECSRVQISVDLYSFGAQYVDLASMAAMPRYTCGEIYHYPGFNLARDEAKLLHEVRHNLNRPTAWEAVMRIRTSKGLRISSFHGHFFNRSTDLLALPTCDPDKAFAVQIAHEENMVPTNVGYVQCALLYTNSNGERRIRVHTLALPVVSELAELYNGADAAAIACLNSKLAVEKLYASHLEETRQTMQQKLIALLKEFRLMNASALRQPNRIIYPPTLRLLPLWTLGTIRTAAFRGGAREVTADERIVAMHWAMQAGVDAFCRYAYPTIYAVHDPSGAWGTDAPTHASADGSMPPAAGGVILPPVCPDTLALLHESGAYLIDNGRLLVLWIGRLVAREWALDVLGGEVHALDPATLKVEPSTGGPLSTRLNRLLSGLRAGRPLYQQCFVVKQGSPLEVHVMPYLVEDRMPATPSYSDFMVAIHKGVLSK